MDAFALTGLIVVALVVAIVLRLAFKSARAVQRLESKAEAPDAPPPPAARRLDVAPPFTLVESRHGWMLVNRNDVYLGQAILRYGECCELEVVALVHLLSLRPGLVVEIGANIGTHSVPIAKALAAQRRQMIVIEPQPFIFNNLCANLALNGLANVRALPFACGERDTTVHFAPPDYSAGGNFGGVSMDFASVAGGTAVPCRRLDDLVGEQEVGLMKVDVEGFELSALRGAEATIDRSRPILYVENDRVEKSDALIDWIRAKDYRMWWHVPPLYNPGNFFAEKDDIYKGTRSINMLCLPRELPAPPSGLEEIVSNRHLLDRS
jgi:FkbM family methyltransferase